MATNPICWWEICTQDTSALAKFYHEVFGWEVKAMPEMNYTVLDSGDGKNGGIGGGLFAPGEHEKEEIPPYLAIYAAVENVDATLAKARELGATVTCEPLDISKVGRIAMFLDPDGHRIGLIKPVEMNE